MQKSFFLITILASTLTLAGTTVTRAQSDPAELVKQSREAINQGNVGSALALYADNATIDWGALCEEAPCVTAGKDKIWKQLVQQVANKQRVLFQKTYVSGNVVTSLAVMSSDAVKKAGIPAGQITEWSITEVQGGKISHARIGILDRSEPQNARFDEWQRSQPPAQ